MMSCNNNPDAPCTSCTTQLEKELLRLRLETAVYSPAPPPMTSKEWGIYLSTHFSSDWLILALISARANPAHRHTSPTAPPEASEGDDLHHIEYFSESHLETGNRLCREFLSPLSRHQIFRVGRNLAILLNPDSDYISDARITSGGYLSQLTEQLSRFLEKFDAACGFRNTVFLSGLRSGKILLRDLYTETLQTFHYGWNRSDPIQMFDALDTTPLTTEEQLELNSLNQEYMSDLEQLLFHEAHQILNRILSIQFSHTVPLQQVLLIVSSRLWSAFTLAHTTLNIPPDVRASLDLSLMRITASASIPELNDRVSDFFGALSNLSPKQSQKKGTMILEYIRRNYKNPDLNAQSLCARFRITAPYLSRLMRQETGSGLVDYIHSFRLVTAKRLLEESDLNIEQVALQSGFSNRYGLIRAFHRLEGCSPRDYREHHRIEM